MFFYARDGWVGIKIFFIIVRKQSCRVAVSHAASEAALLSHSVTALHVCDLSAGHDEPRARYFNAFCSCGESCP